MNARSDDVPDAAKSSAGFPRYFVLALSPILVVVGGLIYSNSLFGSFVYDDFVLPTIDGLKIDELTDSLQILATRDFPGKSATSVSP